MPIDPIKQESIQPISSLCLFYSPFSALEVVYILIA